MNNPNNLASTIDIHVDGMVRLLITILEMGQPHVRGYERLLLVAHLIQLRKVLERGGPAAASAQAVPVRTDADGLRKCLVNFANELNCITHLLNSKLIPKLPDLSRAVRQASDRIQLFRAALRDVHQVSKTQEELFFWASSLTTAVDKIGEAFSSSSLYSLNMWPVEATLSNIGVIRRGNFPELKLGTLRVVTRDGSSPSSLRPTGGISKF